MRKKSGLFITVFVCLYMMGLSPSLSIADEKKVEKPKYVGVKNCKGCHKDQFKVWEGLAMAKSFDTLKSDKSKAISKDAEKDPKCLACHTVGLGEDGGYKIPDASKKEEVEKTKALEGVQCESCHGPGEKYAGIMGAAMGKGTKPDKAALKEAGLTMPDEKTCQKCHNKNSPFFDEKKWNFEENKKLIAHPLKKEGK